jgi:hypothetical protein
MKELKIIKDHVSLLKKNRQLYIGGDNISSRELIEFLADDARQLEQNDIVVGEVNGWHYIRSNNDWIASSSRKIPDWDTAFNRLISFPEGGINTVSHEIFLTAYAKCVFVKDSSRVSVIKGDAPSDLTIELLEKKFGSNSFVVGCI